YALAMQVMPEKTYPLQKINEINSLLAEAARIEREKLDKQALYDKTVLLADKHLSDKNFILARQEYTNALNVFPSEQYPKTKIEEIEQQLALLQQEESKRKDAEQKFSAAIAQADELFKNKKYIDARGFYKQANEIKPADVHSASQVKRIDAMLAQMEAEQKMKVEADMRYNELIANADNKFGTHDYKAARQLYLNALEVKPNETYPREQVKKADERLKILAKADIKQVTTESGSTTAGSTKISDLSFKNESEREKYLASLKEKYPEGITLEIYKEGNKTTKRYIVVRSGEVHEFREIAFTWGGQQYSVDGKPTNLLYLQSQVKPRTGESFVEKEM
ncbi:MAG: hypothetical protein JXB34_11365, partial [Bacteroidales bacterium]|nr:hypothetical protein [Bacteroidales bacterium]